MRDGAARHRVAHVGDGRLAQGFGQTLMEQSVYDERGRLLTGTLMDDAVPRAADVPAVTIETRHTPSPRHPLGAKGLGEAGGSAIPPALVNAVVDALAPCGVTHVPMPLTAEKLWRAMRRGADAPRSARRVAVQQHLAVAREQYLPIRPGNLPDPIEHRARP